MTRVEKMRLQAALQALNGKAPSSKSSHRDSTAAEGVDARSDEGQATAATGTE